MWEVSFLGRPWEEVWESILKPGEQMRTVSLPTSARPFLPRLAAQVLAFVPMMPWFLSLGFMTCRIRG